MRLGNIGSPRLLLNVSKLGGVPLLLTKSSLELEKAIRAHVDCLDKSLGGAEAFEAQECSKSGTNPSSAGDWMLRHWEGKEVSDPMDRHVITDVSSPEHDHARLSAKRSYLMDKLQGHQNAGHSLTHPLVQQRQKVLGQVNEKLAHHEARGVTSSPDHHMDWIEHHRFNDAHARRVARSKGTPAKSTGSDPKITHHVRLLSTPSPQQAEMRQKTASPSAGGPSLDTSRVDRTDRIAHEGRQKRMLAAMQPHTASASVATGRLPVSSAKPPSTASVSMAAREPTNVMKSRYISLFLSV